MRISASKVACMVALLVTITPFFAWSNGDLFFEAMEVPGSPEYVVFGTIKDTEGRYIEGATVTISVHEPRLAYSSPTNMIGRYRTLDIGRAIKGLGYEVDASNIDVTVFYPGHEMARRDYRGKYGQAQGAIEINFILKKLTE